MNEHQRRLWQEMICLIDSYLNHENPDFYGIVGKLEGALDAAEITDEELVEQWYDFWTPLEIRRAVEAEEGITHSRSHAMSELLAMKKFLLLHNTDK
jgi:bisphosphoglycerate-independent phosphoglycerate mutase (AlkP superfamily)